MNGITKVPSRFTNVPPNSTQAAGGATGGSGGGSVVRLPSISA